MVWPFRLFGVVRLTLYVFFSEFILDGKLIQLAASTARPDDQLGTVRVVYDYV
jgi:hypothetical protein